MSRTPASCVLGCLTAEDCQERPRCADRRSGSADPDMDRMMEVVRTAERLKRAMKARGLTEARARCPREGCGGMLHGAIAGPRRHLRMACDEPGCNMRIME